MMAMLVASAALVGAVSAQNATDYEPVDINATVEEYDGNGSLNSSVEVDHARSYDGDAIAVWDWSLEDGNVSSFDDAVNGYNLTGDSGIAKNNDSWVWDGGDGEANSSDPSITTNRGSFGMSFRVNPSYNSSGSSWYSTEGGNDGPIGGIRASDITSPVFGLALTNSQDVNLFVNGSSVGSWTTSTTGEFTVSAEIENGTVYAYENDTEKLSVSANQLDSENFSRIYMGAYETLNYNGSIKDASFYGRPVSEEEFSLLSDEYRLGSFVPGERTTTKRYLGENDSLKLDVDRIKYSELTLEVQYYDGASWITERNTTVGQSGQYDISIEGGKDYRYATSTNSTLASPSQSSIFGVSGQGSNTIFIRGYAVDKNLFVGILTVLILLLVASTVHSSWTLWGWNSKRGPGPEEA